MSAERRYLRVAAVFLALCVLGGFYIFYHVTPLEENAKDTATLRGAIPSSADKMEARPKRSDMDAEWNTYHGSAALTGAIAVEITPPLQPVWRFMAGTPIYNTPVVSNGRVFFAGRKGSVFALDLEGKQVWSQQLSTGVLPDGTPRAAVLDAPLACFGDTVFAGDAGGMVFALDAATGEVRWRQDIGAPILGSPNWAPSSDDQAMPAAGALYIIAQGDGALHCLDVATGEKRWVSEGRSRCDGSPGVGNGVVVYGSCDSALHVFSGITGTLERNITIKGDSQVASGVAIDGDLAFSGCRSGMVLQVNTQTGAIIWSSQVTDVEIFTTPAVSEEWVVLGAEDGFLYALARSSGETQWKFDTGGTPQSPVIAGDKVVVSADGTLYLLNLENGESLWSYEASDFITAPAVAGALILVGSDDGTVAAFRGSDF